jgi:hypothetical protein
MRTFSKLRALCAYPETIDRPSRRRDEAAGFGISYHGHVEQWRDAVVNGRPWDIDGVGEPMRGWLVRMREVWTPTPDLEVEVAMGLADAPAPRYVPVDEPAPHCYVPADLGVTALMWAAAPDEVRQQWQSGMVTAGRADLLRPVGELVQVDDLKTGQSYLGDPKLIRQLLAQGIAATLRAGAAGFIPGIYYARLGVFDRGDGEPIWRGSDEWDQAWDFVVSAAKMSSDPRPGGWCLSCWEKNDCSAFPGERAGR